MRMIFGVLSLLIVLLLVGLLAKKQLGATSTIKLPATPDAAQLVLPAASAGGNAQQQTQQIEQQFKASVEAAVQQARPMPDDK